MGERPSALRLAVGIAVTAAIVTPSRCRAWILPPEPLQLVHWDDEQGLPPGTLSDALQSRDGYIWVGGDEGLTRLDGMKALHLDSRSNPEFSNHRVSALFEDRSGSLWIGTRGGGLFRYEAGRFTAFGEAEGLANGQVSAIAEDARGWLWIGTDGGGLFRRANGRFERVPLGPAHAELFVSGLVPGTGEGMWVANRVALRHFVGDRVETFRAREDLGVSDVIRLAVDSGGVIWVGSRDGLWRFREGRLEQPAWCGQIRNVEALCFGPDSTFWIGTTFGLYRYKEGRLRRFGTADGLAANFVSFLLADREGSLWIGGNTPGVDQLKPTRFAALTPRQGLAHAVTTSVFEDRTGAVWVGTHNGLDRLTTNGITHFSTNQGLAGNLVLSISQDADGAVWVGTLRGLCRITGDTVTRFEPQPGLPSGPIWCLYADRAGGVWGGSQAGLVSIRSNGFRIFNHDNSGLSHDDVRAICEDHEGRIWAGTSFGLNRLENGRCVRYLGDHPDRPFNIVTALHVDSQGALWIGTMDRGLFRYANGGFTEFSTRQGLHDNVVYRILEDHHQALWMTCNRGVFQVSRHQLNALADGSLSRLSCRVFDQADGLPSAECSGTINPAGWRSRDDRLWFPTKRGLAVIYPDEPYPPLHPPPVVLERVLFDEREAPRTSPLRVPPGVRRVEFHYTAPNFKNPGRVRFRWKLEGYDARWIDAGEQRIASYTHLPPGDYRFLAQATHTGQTWSQSGPALALQIIPPWWRTGWFMALAGIALIGSIGGAIRFLERRRYRLRMQSLLHRQALERERARIARDMHDDLGANLVKIAMFGERLQNESDAPERLRTQLRRIAGTARHVVAAFDEVVWTVNPRNDTLENLVSYLARHATEHFADTPIRCHLDLPIDLPAHPLSAEARHSLFLAVKESLNNIVKHSHATEAWISVDVRDARFRICVRDNGRGLDPSPRSRPGSGLSNLTTRMAELGGQFELSHSPGQGTEITLTVPLRKTPGPDTS